MKELDWWGAYSDSLKGKIVDDAFQHPAKMAWGLTMHIFQHLFDRGVLIMSKIQSVCQQCGEKFEHWPSKERKFCSLPCAYKGRDIPSYTQFQANQASDFPPITGLQQQLIWGSLLGDGSLEKRPKGVNAYYVESHSEKQKDYLLYKAGLLGDLISKTRVSKRKKGQKILNEWCMNSHCHPWFTEMWKMFYPKGHKIVPRLILDKLEPFGLAMWYLDDGSTHPYAGGRICTHGFLLEEVQALSDMLHRRFWINNTVRIDRGKYPVIYVTKKGFARLRSLINKFTPASMAYKLDYQEAGICQICGRICSSYAQNCRRCHNKRIANEQWGRHLEDTKLVQLLL